MTLAKRSIAPRQSYRDCLPDHYRQPLGELRTSKHPGHIVMTGSGTQPVVVVGGR